MYAESSRIENSGVFIDRKFSDPNVILALRHLDEDTLAGLLGDAEILDVLIRIRESGEPTRPASEFFAELREELA
ncbi:MAG: hypothetical protein KJO08_11540 [Gammaproteobacteria bacterium]|nr:hypothetical protein [Gammaproteobacteria bacterium]NNJ84319.1 hypothetical protein [Gammaproteobacteria bacterium]